MKKLLLLFCLLVLVGCKKDNTPVTQIVETNKIRIDLTYSYESDVNNSKIEMIQFKGNIPLAVKELNQQLRDVYNKYVKVYGQSDSYSCEIVCYPISNEHYLNVSYTVDVFPTINHYDYGTITSYAYDLVDMKLIDINKAYLIANTTKEKIEEDLNNYIQSEIGETPGGIKSIGFMISEKKEVTFIVCVKSFNAFGEEWGHFYSYKNGEMARVGAYPFKKEDLDTDLSKELLLQKENGVIIKEPFTITYVLDGGTNSFANPDTYSIFSHTFSFDDPTKPGATFGGWFKDPEFTIPISTVERGSVGDLTLYARWADGDYVINYILDNGINSPNNPNNYNIYNTPIYLEDPIREGYQFLGWFKDIYMEEQVTVITGDMQENLTLYAFWAATSGIEEITPVQPVIPTPPPAPPVVEPTPQPPVVEPTPEPGEEPAPETPEAQSEE